MEEGPELPFGWQLWRPVRQRIYAVLFNLNHRLFLSKQEKESPKDNTNASKNKVTVTSCVSLKPGKEPGKYPSGLLLYFKYFHNLRSFYVVITFF